MSYSMEDRMAQIRERRLWSPDEILPRLFLGNGQDASNGEKLREHQFTHIINVADDVDNFFPKQFTYLNLHVSDFGTDKGITRVFPEAFEFLSQHWKENEENKILVHCAAGMNRSATLCIAVVMHFQNLTLREAYELVMSKRRVCPIRDNRDQLMIFEEQSRGTLSMSDAEFTTLHFRLQQSRHA